MTPKAIFALSAILAASPLVAAQPDSGPIETVGRAAVTTPAPPGGPNTKYCMRVEITGNIAEPVRCWTRLEWADQGVDLDRDWATEGVRIIEA